MKVAAVRQQGYKLLHQGAIELASVEANGIRVDVAKLEKTKADLQQKMRLLKEEIQQEDYWKTWQRRYGEKANLTSRTQLATVLHVDLGHEISNETETGRPATDEEALQKLYSQVGGLGKLVRFLRYEKALGTFLAGIGREIVGDRIHPAFHLHTARTFRSSSSEPNFQNFPVRDKEVSELVRSHFIASKGHVLVENDFKGAEVVVSSAYHKDRNFISYITNPKKDMHRDMAAQIYKLEQSEVSKEIRYGAKNKFVFPQFYGDYYVACAKNLWEWIRLGDLKGPDGKSLFNHLKKNGIAELGDCDPEVSPREGTFEKHLQEVEDDFWNHRFREYGQWRKDWYRKYLKRGHFDMLTGFRVHGSFNRNSVVNYPVQGSAFHCLLWALIRVSRALKKYRMKSMLVGQVHDSMVGDVHEKELKDYLEIVEGVVTVKLRAAYRWLVVPLEIEYEIAPPGGSWFDKKEVEFSKGRFFHPENKEKFTTDPARFLETIR